MRQKTFTSGGTINSVGHVGYPGAGIDLAVRLLFTNHALVTGYPLFCRYRVSRMVERSDW